LQRLDKDKVAVMRYPVAALCNFQNE